jgi:glycine cleavage system aminomethyltransferase T
VSIENVTDETGVLSIVGPNARELLADAVGDKDLLQNWKFLDAKKVLNNFSKIVFNI